jgi:nicotinate-nucleotide adenylyltransferase
MKIGLFFGSFNPIHVGHLIIANVMAETTDLDKVWFVVSPQNPFKQKQSLLHEFDRYDMVRAAIHENFKLDVTDIEFNMPKPSYTVDTLAYLSSRHPDKEFSLIIGGDNLHSFPKWKNHEVILGNHPLYVYPRPNAKPSKLDNHPSITFVDAPLLDISATFIRKCVQKGLSIQYMVHPAVEEIIQSRKFYLQPLG